MKLLPDSKVSRIRASILFVIFLGACAYRNAFSLLQLAVYQPREGDILFQSLPHGELVDAIEGVTQSPWSHCGILMRIRDQWIVVEAIGSVRETPLAWWIARGRAGRFAAYRLRPTSDHPLPDNLHEGLVASLKNYMGRPYDFRYAPEDGEIYCSELEYKGYRDAFGLELGSWEQLGKLNWKPFESVIRALDGGSLPLDRPMITPAGLTRSVLLSRAYPAER